jgi:hypothetical protein
MSTSVKKRKREGGGSRIVSYGILLYKRVTDLEEEASSVQFLLGLIPQRTNWTVFKGVPDEDGDKKESPEETALREFEEETGTKDLLTSRHFRPEATLHGRAGKKHLEIFLHEGSFFQESDFCLERVVKIDSSYMKGKPEIVAVRWMDLRQALEGVQGAAVYKSQEDILREAHNIVLRQESKEEKQQRVASPKQQSTDNNKSNVCKYGS